MSQTIVAPTRIVHIPSFEKRIKRQVISERGIKAKDFQDFAKKFYHTPQPMAANSKGYQHMS